MGTGTTVSGFDLQFDQISMSNFGGQDLTVDEIRLGTGLADVAAVPEPALAGLLGTGVMCLVGRRRRRQG